MITLNFDDAHSMLIWTKVRLTEHT